MVDEIDKRIISYLKENSRMPFMQIARNLRLSESTIRKRVKKLSRKGVIRRFTLHLDPKLEFENFVGIKCKPKTTKDILKQLKSLNLNGSLYEVTGSYDVFFFIAAKNPSEMNTILNKIRDISGIESTESFIVVGKE